MKKTIALLLVAMLLGIGLVVSCGGDDPEPEPTPVVKFKVTFDSDGRPFADGTTVAKVVEVEKDATVGNKWPEIDEENIGTDTLQGWFDGATEVTKTTKITKDVTLKAKFEAALFTFDTATRAAVHTNFVITSSQSGKHGAWDAANTEDGGNKFSIKTGGIQYRQPVTVNFDYNDYDFVDVEYTASGVNNTVLKYYDLGDDYADATPNNVANTAENEKKVVTFEIRKASFAAANAETLPSPGLAIQKYGAGATNMTIKITKITFIQRTRYKIKFNTDGGTPATLPDSYLVEATKVGNYLPSKVTKEGFVFGGWVNGTAAVTSASVVDNKFNNATLKALWLTNVPNLTAIIPNFSAASDITAHGSATVILVGTDGYEQTGANYDGIYVSFKITIPTGATLAHYDKITFTMEGTQGDSAYKPVWLMAADTISDNAAVRSIQVSNEIQYSKGPQDISLTITKPAAANLTGEIDVSIMFRAGGSTASVTQEIPAGTTKVKVTKIKFVP